MLELDPKQKVIVAALEDPRYKWRTLNGITDQTGLSREEVMRALATLIDFEIVIKSSIPAASGDDLYTTRKHYMRLTPFGKRLGAAFRNRPQ